jgi:hypothetical protein
MNAGEKCLILLFECTARDLVSFSHYFLQFSGKIIALGKSQPTLLGDVQIIPATFGEAKKLNYDSEASIRGKCFLFKGNIVLKSF